MEQENNNLMPELKDIKNRILAYNAIHPEGCFVFRFVGYKDSDEVCEECGEKCMCELDNNKSEFGIFGDIETVRKMLNELRDMAEDCQDEDGMVII